jgi:hypothetical protein
MTTNDKLFSILATSMRARIALAAVVTVTLGVVLSTFALSANWASASPPVKIVSVEPFQQEFRLDWPDGQDGVTGSYQVPAGKRLVIEYASLFAFLEVGGQNMFVRIVTMVNGSDGVNTLALQKQPDYGVLPQFGAAHTVHIYADPGSTVRVTVGRTPATGSANCVVTLSGHFENAHSHD